MDISALSDDKSRINVVFYNAENPFSGLETQYLQSKYLKKNLLLW